MDQARTDTAEGARDRVAGRGDCRLCGAALEQTVVDLGMSPLCESYVPRSRLDEPEIFYPLRVFVCTRCLLVQLAEYVRPEEIFSDYAYFSSYSESWLAHAQAYARRIPARLGLDHDSTVVEVASNDGYLLQYFVELGMPVLGIEPAANVAAAAVAKGIDTRVAFFGLELAERLVADGVTADLLIGNNVLAQVPDLRGFIAGMARLLSPRGVVTVEFPHLVRLVEGNQFDTIYHEHFSYFSLSTCERAFAREGLVVFDVEELPTHGGSLRVYARHEGDDSKPVTDEVARLRAREHEIGLASPEYYAAFASRVEQTRYRLLEFLIDAKRRGTLVVGYGAPGKGNTLLNYCGVRGDLLPFTVDRNPHKQGMLLPGTHIPIEPPERIHETGPDYVLILPWNLQDEIAEQMAGIRSWGGRFVVAIPDVRVLP